MSKYKDINTDENLKTVDNEISIDYAEVMRRIKRSGLRNELLVRAAKPARQAARRSGRAPEDAAAGLNEVTEAGVTTAGRPGKAGLTAIDATAGFGEDAFVLAAAGYDVTMIERNPVLAAMIRDALARSAGDPELAEITARMHIIEGDSIEILRKLAGQNPALTNNPEERNQTLKFSSAPDLIYLDPMFPASGKSALSKKKLQFIKSLQNDYYRTKIDDEEKLLEAAMAIRPAKIIIKRPLKGPLLGGITPGYSIKGKLIRYDCIVLK